MKRLAFGLGVVVVGCPILLAAPEGELRYPESHRVEHVDEYHGTAVADPYQWLETPVKLSQDGSAEGVDPELLEKSREVVRWVEAQNEVTFGYLDEIPEREAIQERLTELWNYEKFTTPFKAGGRYYYSRNDGLQNQYVVYMMDSLEDEPRVLFDPNTWSEDGTVALGGMAFSDDGRYVAYGKQDAGSDWRTWHIRDLETGEDLPETLRWIKFSGVSWTKDSRGFFYSRFPEPEEGQEFQSLNLNQEVYHHRVGTPQELDVLVYKRPDEPEWGFGADVTDDGRYLVITVHKGTDPRYRVLYRDLAEPYAMPLDLIDNFENEYSFLGNSGPVFYFQTDVEAPRRRIIAIDTRKPQREHWKEIVPQAEETIQGAGITGNMFVVSYLKDAVTRVRMFDMRGEHVRDVEFPTLGSAGGFGGKQTDTETFYSFSSFAVPPTIYRYDMITGESTLLRRAEVAFDADQYETKQVFYTSRDGTKVPMFLCHKRGIRLDGGNPTLLYGYGGFNIPMTPYFSVSRVAWMEMGGVYAVANLRGGGEYGREWHKAGTKTHKQNVFDDFIGAAEWLIANKYTRPSKLAIQGGSNGGLLVGAVMTQRPDLFGVALPAVGVMDMLKFHKWTAGRYWVDDYGSSEASPEEFRALYAYSPYHQLLRQAGKGMKYPATMVTTADTDDRVVPGHSFKFAAALQSAQAGEAPVLIRIETRAGHGAGKPTAKIIEEQADIYAFTAKNLGMVVPGRD